MLRENKTARFVDVRIRRKNFEDHKRKNWICRRGRKETSWRTRENERKMYLGSQRKRNCWERYSIAWRIVEVDVW